MGTCGPQNRAVMAAERRLADKLVDKLGPKAHHPLFARLSTGRFNKAFAPNRTASDWVTRDAQEVDRYVADPLCGFDLTVSGYRDVVYLQSEVTSERWLRRVPKSLPILLISGDQDPLGDFERASGAFPPGLRLPAIRWKPFCIPARATPSSRRRTEARCSATSWLFWKRIAEENQGSLCKIYI